MSLVFVVFVLLTLVSFTLPRLRQIVLARKYWEWQLDGINLLIQGALIPILQSVLLAASLRWLWPEMAGRLFVPSESIWFRPWVSTWFCGFVLGFVVVDYLYYWNHRLLHQTKFWPLHVVHHTPQRLDYLATSRNAWFSSFFIVYLWIGALFLYLLHDPRGFLLGSALTSALDLWRHSGLRTNHSPWLQKLLGRVLILPEDHEWHHSRDKYNVNFGANLNLWDRMHHTFYRTHSAVQVPSQLGVTLPLQIRVSLPQQATSTSLNNLRFHLLQPWRLLQ